MIARGIGCAAICARLIELIGGDEHAKAIGAEERRRRSHIRGEDEAVLDVGARVLDPTFDGFFSQRLADLPRLLPVIALAEG